jgi:hypothetical protein
MTRNTPRVAGGIGPILPGEPDYQTHVAAIYIDRGLASGTLTRAPMTEAKLAEVVATGAAILQRLAKERGRA